MCTHCIHSAEMHAPGSIHEAMSVHHHWCQAANPAACIIVIIIDHRMVTTPDGEDAKFLKWLDAMAAEEFGGRGTTGASGTGSKRHENEWYADRCVFCTACSKAIDAEHGRRGVRCSGCRRWFHSHCRPKRAIQGSGDADHVDGSSSSSKGRYFHSCECEAVYQALHRAAAEGQRQLAVGPRSRSGGIGGLMDNLFGGGRDAAGKGDAGEQLTFRLIDLADVKQQVGHV